MSFMIYFLVNGIAHHLNLWCCTLRIL